MKQTVKDRLFLVFKLAVTLFVISPFYIAVIYSVKSKPEMVSNRLAFPCDHGGGRAGHHIDLHHVGVYDCKKE